LIGFVVEGPSDVKTIREICRKIEVAEPQIRLTGGHDPRKAVSLSKLLLDRGCKKVVILKDTNCSDPEKVKESFVSQLRDHGMTKQFEQGVKICPVVSAIESWMLADEEAIADYLGIEVEEIYEPERIHKPDETMNEIFKKHEAFQHQYLKGGTDPEEIAKRLDVQKVRKKCPHYIEFEKALEDP
jgi:hypothetical protein